MNIGGIIERMKREGVQLSLTTSGTLKVAGEENVVKRWLPILKDHKTEVKALFQERAWAKGNPFTCITCGHPTGWTLGGTPICPCCVPPPDPAGYRRRMLALAREMEAAAGANTDLDKKAVRLALVVAIREDPGSLYNHHQ